MGNNIDTRRLLSLLQLSDSALPVGAFSHSFGFETWVERGVVRDTETALSAITSVITLSVGPTEGRAVAIAHGQSRQAGPAGQLDNRCSSDRSETDRSAFNQTESGQCDSRQSRSSRVQSNLYQPVLAQFEKLNSYLSASRWTDETHRASLSMGARLRQLAQDTGMAAVPPGDVHYCAAFGWIAGSLEIACLDAVSAYLFSAATQLVLACVRLVPLGHTDGQRILTELSGTIARQCHQFLASEPSELSAFAPLHEWASIEHERLYCRLFQS